MAVGSPRQPAAWQSRWHGSGPLAQVPLQLSGETPRETSEHIQAVTIAAGLASTAATTTVDHHGPCHPHHCLQGHIHHSHSDA